MSYFDGLTDSAKVARELIELDAEVERLRRFEMAYHRLGGEGKDIMDWLLTQIDEGN
jgi:hypothetical protein